MKKHTLLVAAALALFALAPLGAHAGQPAFPWGTITVTPSTGLADGQTVQVSGANFLKNTQLLIIECGPSQGIPPVGGFVQAICTSSAVSVKTGPDGSFVATSFTVSTVIHGTQSSHGQTVPATYDCSVANDCHIHVFAPVTGVAAANQDISFG
jgi:neocarzinostatin family protein